LQLRALPDLRFWAEGSEVRVGPYDEGSVSIVDLARNPTWDLRSPFDALHLYLPRTALNQITDDCNAAPITALSNLDGQVDYVAQRLGHCLLPAFEAPAEASAMFVDHIILAFASHIARTYGGLQPETKCVRGGLTSRQERRAKEVLLSYLEGGGSLVAVAKECGLSPGHFSRSFKESVGAPPHRWLTDRRLENAGRLLTETDMPLAEIALTCGFGDQSHLTRMFSRKFEDTPGAWRRKAR
jgi:AraC family transcriptional regulator